MSSGAFYLAVAAGIGFACAVAFVGLRALRESKTVEVFVRPPQEFMLQVNPPSEKVQAMGLPVRSDPGAELKREKQA